MSIGCSAKIYRAAHGLQPFGRCFTCHSPSKPRLTARYVRAIAPRTVKVVRHREACGGCSAFDRAPAAARSIGLQLQRVCREVFSEGELLPSIPDVWENGRAPPGRFWFDEGGWRGFVTVGALTREILTRAKVTRPLGERKARGCCACGRKTACSLVCSLISDGKGIASRRAGSFSAGRAFLHRFPTMPRGADEDRDAWPARARSVRARPVWARGPLGNRLFGRDPFERGPLGSRLFGRGPFERRPLWTHRFGVRN